MIKMIYHHYNTQDDNQKHRGQMVAIADDGLVYKVEISIDTSYLSQSWARVSVKTPNGFAPLLEQHGSEFELARDYHDRHWSQEAGVNSTFERMTKIAMEIARK